VADDQDREAGGLSAAHHVGGATAGGQVVGKRDDPLGPALPEHPGVAAHPGGAAVPLPVGPVDLQLPAAGTGEGSGEPVSAAGVTLDQHHPAPVLAVLGHDPLDRTPQQGGVGPVP
jgi:hypothetical protein